MLQDPGFQRVPLSLGRVAATPAVLQRVPAPEIIAALDRHRRHDWGELDAHDRGVNTAAVRTGARVLSAYTASNGEKFWIITEADRSATTVLLPSEY